MTVFYRYLRPVRFNEHRAELITQPNGGICLRFDELPEGDLFFTYARCHPEDHFNKAVARTIADNRAIVARSDAALLGRLRHIPYSQSTDVLVMSIIRSLETPPPTPNLLVEHYMRMDYEGFARYLESLYNSNLVEQRLATIWKCAISDVWKTAYVEGAE